MAFAVRGQSKMVEKGACMICGRYGHEEAACYEVIGYPLGWVPMDEDEKIEVAEAIEEAEELFVVAIKNQWQQLLKKLGKMNSLQA